MINKITPETTVAEICEVLEFIETMGIGFAKVVIYNDLSGDFKIDGEKACGIEELSDYIEIHQEELSVNKFKNMSEAEANARLLKSAPDMRDALIELYKNMRHPELYTEVKDLIERATGLSIEEVLCEQI